MSETRKYYYLKLKETWFENDGIKIIESMENGIIYSLVILKLYLKSCRYNGCLMMSDRIPYDPTKIDILASVIGHDKDHVKSAIQAAVKFDLIAILESGEIWMSDIQSYIGRSSTEADRKRDYRLKITDGQMSDKNPPEIEIEIEIEKEKEIEKEARKTAFETFWSLYDKKVKKSTCVSHWKKVKPDLYETIFEHVKKYVAATPDKTYRKDPERYIKHQCWNDEIIIGKQEEDPAAEYLRRKYGRC